MKSRAGESFEEFFRQATGFSSPYAWQTLLAKEGFPEVLPVPTGLGKTEVVLAWACAPLVYLLLQSLRHASGAVEIGLLPAQLA